MNFREERAIRKVPPPAELVRQMKKQRVTIDLTSDSVDFFKFHGKKLKVPYRTLMSWAIERYIAELATG